MWFNCIPTKDSCPVHFDKDIESDGDGAHLLTVLDDISPAHF